ncbi:MAG TPA: SMI1/KNR4 family protein [Blastocatellia bacterium]|nr:SMI1/KNR4 family protein [Blastocatellia bacterium]
MTGPWTRLAEHWRSQGLPIMAGCSETEIASAERRWSCALPRDFRDYLASLGGMNPYYPGDQDAEGYSFWPLERLRTAVEEARDHKWNACLLFPGAAKHVLFADYLCWCWALAFDVAETSPAYGSVCVIGHAVPVQIAGSFAEFVELYIVGSDALYPAPPRPW